MTQLQTFREMPIAEAMAAIERHKDNPSLMPTAFMDLTNSITNGEVAFVDGTNPLVLTMEMFSLGLVSALKENASSLRRVYSDLAETPEELADHVSDWSAPNRFAVPSSEPFRIYIGLEAFMQNAVRDENEKCKKIIIPRDTFLTKDGRTFTFNYPIIIRYYDVGSLEISYDTSIVSRFQTLSTNILDYGIYRTPDEIAYISFTAEVMQMEITRYPETSTAGQLFSREYSFNDQFFTARAWYRNTRTLNKWVEMNTSHGRLNYDRRTPTLLLRVEDGKLRVQLPQIYMLNDRLLGDICVDIYTTKGNMNEVLPQENYEVGFRALDPTELNDYTPQALSTVPRMAVPEGTITGGRDGLTFEQLRSRVIHNDSGPQQIPISPTAITSSVEDNGFTLSKMADVATERVFYASRKLPPPTNSKLITSANIGIHTFITTGDDLRDHPFVYSNGKRWTMSPKNLYVLENGKIRLLSAQEVQELLLMDLSSKVNRLNSRQYLYTPFHYVFDNENREFDLRAYYLDKPKSDVINFIRMNSTLQLVVNTDSNERAFYRTEDGFQLRIRLKSGNLWKSLSDNQVGVQLRFSPKGDTTNVFIRGQLLGMSNEERVYGFDFKTNFDLNDQDAIRINGVAVNGTENQYAWADLDTRCELFICTNVPTNNYTPDESIRQYADWLFAPGFVPITHESITLKFGYALKTLWRRARNQTSGYDFKRWTTTVQKVYETDQYKMDPDKGVVWVTNPATGRPERVLEHRKGDLMYDPLTEEPIYDHVAGQVILDEAGIPIPGDEFSQPKEADILFIDGRHYFVTDRLYLEYNQELVDILVDWVADSLVDTQNRVLEKTKAYLYPRSQIGPVRVDLGDNKFATIQSEQSPRIDLYLNKTVYNDDVMRATIMSQSIKTLDGMFNGTGLNQSEITKALETIYAGTVESFRLYGFGPDRNIYYANVTQADRTLSLKRIIEPQANGTLIMREDVTFNFFLARSSTST